MWVYACSFVVVQAEKAQAAEAEKAAREAEKAAKEEERLAKEAAKAAEAAEKAKLKAEKDAEVLHHLIAAQHSMPQHLTAHCSTPHCFALHWQLPSPCTAFGDIIIQAVLSP
jgi:hypothetical protein